MKSRVCQCLLLSLGLLGVSTAQAAVESELVNQGVLAYHELDYSKATDLLKRALSETLTREETLIVYETLAFCNVAQEKIDQARVDFERVLRFNPKYQLGRTISPRIRKVFEEARANIATGKTTTTKSGVVPNLSVKISPEHPKDGQPVVLSLDYPGGLARKLHLYHRIRGQAAFSEASVAPWEGASGRFSVTVPGLSVQAPALEYYLIVEDEEGLSIAESGSLAKPLALTVLSRAKPIYKRGWFWGVVGGIAASGVVAAVLATTLIHSPSKNAGVTLIPQ